MEDSTTKVVKLFLSVPLSMGKGNLKGTNIMGSTSTITINTNLSALTCQKYLSDATKGMNNAMERLSTGFKINSGKDDAAGYSVVEGMQAKVNGYDVIDTNAKMGLDMLTTQEGVLDILNEYLQRIRDLTMQAANGTYGSASLNAIKIEVEQRMDEINRLCSVTEFNDTYLLDGSRKDSINLQVGLYSNNRCVITMDEFLFASAKSTSIMGFTGTKEGGYVDLRNAADNTDGIHIYRARRINSEGQPVDVNNNVLPQGAEPEYLAGYYASPLAAAMAENGVIQYQAGETSAKIVGTAKGFTIEQMCDAIYRNDNSAREFIDNIDKAIDNVSLRVTQIGAYMNRLESAIDATDVQRENLTEAISTIRDADVAVESSNYIKYQILQQSTATLLSTANQQPQIALNLL